MSKARVTNRLILGLIVSVSPLPVLAQSAPASPAPSPSLESEFRDPPADARPRVWWHWLSGNVTSEGISRDLEWMKRIGVAGAMMFDGDMDAPKIVPQRVTVLSPAWYANLHHAAQEADRLGLEFAMAAAPGWSETGGPWVKPEAGMKKFVWSEMRVSRAGPVGRLPPLPSVAGPFQSIRRAGRDGKSTVNGPVLARDVAVLAFRAPAGEIPLSALPFTMRASDPDLDMRRLVDGDLEQRVLLPAPAPNAPAWVRFDFASPQTMRALTYVGPMAHRFADGPQGRIEASDDGKTWRSVRTLVGQGHNPSPQRTFAFPATRARSFRIVFDHAQMSREPWPVSPGIPLAELALVPGARTDLFEDKAGFGVLARPQVVPTPSFAEDSAIASGGILDVTDRLRPDGTLDWRAPAGDWIILRAGWSLTGIQNHPATPEGTGLEADKLSAEHVRDHLDAYVSPVVDKLGDLAGKRGLRYILTDSWEAGQENWTEAMPAEFRRRRGYDLTRMLPVLAGHVVDSAERSDAFLWDFRRTLGDLIAENHYGTITRFAKEHGLGYYGEATGAAWPTVADGMLAKSLTDIPMGEFWAIPFGGKPAAFHQVRSDEFPADIIETRSTAHVYGKQIVAAEALTSSLPQWTSTPWNLKWVVDKYLAMGVNRLVLHTSPHQPDDTHKPGLTLGPFGQVFTRHETWGEMAKPWTDYLARSSFLLQQGTPVADVLYFYGEGAPSGVPYDADGDPADLHQWGFDYVNSDALLRLAQAGPGGISFPGGASYRVMVLPRDADRLTLGMLKRLRDLVEAGAVIVGRKPVGSPSLEDNAEDVRTMADQLWGQTDGHTLTINRFGKGRVYWRSDLLSVLAEEKVAADFEATPADPGMDIRFAHRRTGDTEIYFVTNQSDKEGTVPIRFRVEGRAPELWDPASGGTRPLSYRVSGGRTEVPLPLSAYESAFVIFRRPSSSTAVTVSPPSEQTLAAIDNWTLSVPIDPARPTTIAVSSGSWTSQALPEIRYFSGVATYSRKLSVKASWLHGPGRLVLDLGRIGDVAEVWLNGKLAGTAWKPPYRVDITEAARSGGNDLEIRVANTWQNRFVGDFQPGAVKHAWTNAAAGGGYSLVGEPLSAATSLTPSGLLSEVKILRISTVSQ